MSYFFEKLSPTFSCFFNKNFDLVISLNSHGYSCSCFRVHCQMKSVKGPIISKAVELAMFQVCYNNNNNYYYYMYHVFVSVGFPAMRDALNRTGRPIVYSCQWPMYARYYGGTVRVTHTYVYLIIGSGSVRSVGLCTF